MWNGAARCCSTWASAESFGLMTRSLTVVMPILRG